MIHAGTIYLRVSVYALCVYLQDLVASGLSVDFIGSSIFYLNIVTPTNIIVSPFFNAYRFRNGIRVVRPSVQTPVQTDTPRSWHCIWIGSLKS